jgi:hypothetical protein
MQSLICEHNKVLRLHFSTEESVEEKSFHYAISLPPLTNRKATCLTAKNSVMIFTFFLILPQDVFVKSTVRALGYITAGNT